MASKHDAKRARENIWVMQSNLARQKGQQFWMQRPVQPKIAKGAAPKAEPEAVAEPADAPAAESAETAAPEPARASGGAAKR